MKLYSSDMRLRLEVSSEVYKLKSTGEQVQYSLVSLTKLNQGDDFLNNDSPHNRSCFAVQMPTNTALRVARAFDEGAYEPHLQNIYDNLIPETNQLESMRSMRVSVEEMQPILAGLVGVTVDIMPIEDMFKGIDDKIAHLERMESDPEYASQQRRSRMKAMIAELLCDSI